MADLTIAQFIFELQRMAQREPLMREQALKRAAETVRDEARALVGTEDPSWAPLADATVAEKSRLGYVGQITATDPLLRTGRLRDSIEIRAVSPDRAVIASDDPILAFQEFGTARIPPRPVIGTALFRTKAAVEHLIGEAAARLLRGQPDA
jgi:phage gpG-like protein